MEKKLIIELMILYLKNIHKLTKEEKKIILNALIISQEEIHDK